MKRTFQIKLTLTGLLTAALITFIGAVLILIKPAQAHSGHFNNERVTVTNMSIEKIEYWINESTRPEFDERVLPPIMSTLVEVAVNGTMTPRERLAYARLLQHEHDFDGANQQLDILLSQSPISANALLLKANVALNQGQPELAVKQCLKLFGKVSSVVIGTCVLEAKMQLAPSPRYYNQLLKITGQFAADSSAVKVWVNEVLADMALYNDQPRQAISHLEAQPFSDWPVSSWVAWSKAKLAVGEGQDILNELAPYVAFNPVPNDSMLLYLALAELQAGDAERWVAKMTQRVDTREQHEETTHAAEMAQYYWQIAQRPAQALRWAKINWQQAKSLNDKLLLTTIERMQAEQS
ncbi:tetratricopeptide repeat protein [Alteromonas gilva]|uniref:Tetratricopeptide repeat protein n=1 Tax=Alteromonas gilva TaxID=2987522 RepID=A0ABT5L647_9ALTE|nr:hypothetical protein [Alteromonas gilva]MDC8832337.1 hypothetical protein [Alteromonas gilva]